MSENIDVPKIGPVNKKAVFIIGGAAVVFVGWRWYSARNAPADAVDGTDTTDPYADAGTIPSVSGAVSPSNSYGLSDPGTSTTVDAYGFTGTTNAQWTQYATTQLVQSDRWSYTDIVTALGNYLNNKSLNTTQQSIVQAAIAVAGYPPQGSHTIISGGDTAITVAPGNLRAWDAATTSQIGMQWNSVAGASHYRIFRTDLGEPIGDSVDTKFHAQGLTQNTPYKFQVAAVTGSGQVGPKSNVFSAKTKALTLTKPSGVKASNITKSSFVVTCSRVTGATNYRWYLNGSLKGSTDAPTFTFSGLKAHTRYRVTVKADVSNQSPGPDSTPIYVTTKK